MRLNRSAQVLNLGSQDKALLLRRGAVLFLSTPAPGQNQCEPRFFANILFVRSVFRLMPNVRLQHSTPCFTRTMAPSPRLTRAGLNASDDKDFGQVCSRWHPKSMFWFGISARTVRAIATYSPRFKHLGYASALTGHKSVKRLDKKAWFAVLGSTYPVRNYSGAFGQLLRSRLAGRPLRRFARSTVRQNVHFDRFTFLCSR